MGFTKEQMAKGGKNSTGPRTKTKQWEELSEYFINEGAERVVNHLQAIKDDDEFFQKYERLLNYFKPKMQSTQIKSDNKIIIEMKDTDYDYKANAEKD